MQIFSFITAIAVVILTILIAIILLYYSDFMNFRAISDILRNGTENAEEHIETLVKI